MAWQDRLREAAYTSPSGERITFAYEDVRRAVAKRTAVFEFVGVDGAFIQDNGVGPRRYPLQCFFTGDNCDLEADRFEVLLLESGTGKLEHPLYGTKNVVPFGEISRRDNLKSAANQSLVRVVLFETFGEVFPAQEVHGPSAVNAGVDNFISGAAESFGAQPSELSLSAALGSIKSALGAVASATAEAQREFDAADAAVNGVIDLLVATPLDIAQAMIRLVQSPARAAALIAARLDAYGNLLASTIASADKAIAEGLGAELGGAALPLRQREKLVADFRLADLVAMTAVSGGIIAAALTGAEFETRKAALEAAERITVQFEVFVAWRDEHYRQLEQTDDGVGYQRLHTAVGLIQEFLVQISFGLLSEKRIVLDRARSLIDLSAELYGSVSNERLDFLITTNSLTGSEILELPQGKEVSYFV